MPYIPEEIVKKVNEIPIMDFIYKTDINVKQVTKNNPDYFVIPHNGGTYITPSINKWNCFAMKTGSTGVIGFVQYMYNLNWKDAVQKIIDTFNINEHSIENSNTSYNKKDMQEKIQEEKEFILPEKNNDYKRVFAYLNKTRKIDTDFIKLAVNEDKIYQDKKYGNLIFKIIDEENNVVGASWYSTLTSDKHKGKKGLVAGSKKTNPFEFKGTGTKLYVFESPIDLMSYLTIKKQNNEYENIKDETFIATFGLTGKDMVIKYLEKNKQINEVNICFDNDKDATIYVDGKKVPRNHGQEDAKKLKEELEEKYKVNIITPIEKDFNDDLLKKTKELENSDIEKEKNQEDINLNLKNLYDEEKRLKEETYNIMNKIDDIEEKLLNLKKNYETTITKIIDIKNRIIIEKEKEYKQIIKNNAYTMIKQGIDINIVHNATKIEKEELQSIKKSIYDNEIKKNIIVDNQEYIDENNYDLYPNYQEEEEAYQVLENI